MITSPSLIAPAIGELACTSQGFLLLVALTRNAWSPGTGALMTFALGLSGWKCQVPLVSLLIMRLAMSSSAIANEHAATPASKKAKPFMRLPPDLVIVLDTYRRNPWSGSTRASRPRAYSQ